MTNTFDCLGLAEPLRLALKAENYTTPTPIQRRAIPAVLSGRDLLAVADTGTGKTAAFGLPILQRLADDGASRMPDGARALILAPTRELASQIAERLEAYGKYLDLKTAVVFGGVGYGDQFKTLKSGVDILVATPGRLLELIARKRVRLDGISILLLDEADRMLDMGFIRDVKKIVGFCPRSRQTLLFSATMPPPIAALAQEILRNAHRIDVAPAKVTAPRIDQRVYFVNAKDKPALLAELVNDADVGQGIVFTRTKRGADRVCRHLVQAGVAAVALHGNKAQNARVRALDGLRSGKTRILVATDIAARGIDVPGITHVINYDMPNEPESYVHRIGRTARAGAEGIALSFCDSTEQTYLKAIERLTRLRLEAVDHPLAVVHDDLAPPPAKPRSKARPQARSKPKAKPLAQAKPKPVSAERRPAGSGPSKSAPGNQAKRRRSRFKVRQPGAPAAPGRSRPSRPQAGSAI